MRILTYVAAIAVALAWALAAFPFVPIIMGAYEGGEQAIVPMLVSVVLSVAATLCALPIILKRGHELRRRASWILGLAWTPLALFLVVGMALQLILGDKFR